MADSHLASADRHELHLDALDRHPDVADAATSPANGNGPAAQRQGEPVWQVRDLNVTYAGMAALSGIDMDIHDGGVTAIIGPSGCGKSTFLFCLNRLSDLIPGCRVDGRVMLHSHDIFSPGTDLTALRRHVGIIFQKPNPFPTTIWRNLEMPLKQSGIRDKAEIAARIEECLTAVGLWNEVRDRLRRPALGLSGGQQQRLCIARALTLRPEALLMDEPCSALDPIATGVIEELIGEFRGKYTTVVVTHNLGQARRIGTDVAFFWNEGRGGRIIERGPVEKVFDAPEDDLTRLYVEGRIA
nr:phosphate ABC transporter ATP-binding protein [Ferruginivarius sediminum]